MSRPTKSSSALEIVIASLCSKEPQGRTICPMDAAKAYAAQRGEDELALALASG